ncbi:MAG: STT3 domain-containing protein [Halorientalis sp.]
MSDPREELDTLLAERPDLESALHSILEVDERMEAWTFDDVPVDSGVFGELVSRDIVEHEHVDGGDAYRVADPDTVRAVLNGEPDTDMDPTTRSWSVPGFALPTVSVNPTVAGGLVGALALLFIFRLVALPTVFRNGHIVLSGNDPYYYRFWVERLAAEATGVFDVSVLSELPGAVAKGEPLMVATLWGVAELLSGGSKTVGVVLAWYPVVSALITGVLLYVFTVRLTDDQRIGIAAVALLAIIPVHAFRTSLGFADHHAFDYPWLVLTALALTTIAVTWDGRLDARPWTWRIWPTVTGLGVGVAGQTLAWEAGPLLIAPIGAYVALRVLSDVRADRSPLLANLPVVAGLAFGALLAHLGHTGFGWHTAQVAYAPAILLLGVLGVILVGEVFHRLALPAIALGGTEAVGFVLGTFVFQSLLPTYWNRLQSEFAYLFRNQAIAEVQPLFGANSFGWLLLFGFLLVFALPYFAWASWRTYREHRPGWLVPTVYGWFFMVLSAIQLRFAGELAPFVAVFAGLGVVHLAERIDIARVPAPFRDDAHASADSTVLSVEAPDARQTAYLATLFILVGGLGMMQVPVKVSQLTIDDDQYAAATWMDDYAAEQGWEYPQNYVFSEWGRNRMYNYFVNGHSRSYSYARSNYLSFAGASDSQQWYNRLKGRVGFIVMDDRSSADQFPSDSLYFRLYRHFGSRANGAPGVAHYRAVRVVGGVKIFTLVPGATITGTGPVNETLTATTTISIGNDTFTYKRQVKTGPDGMYAVTVPYPGNYRIGDQQVTVPEHAIKNGTTVST